MILGYSWFLFWEVQPPKWGVFQPHVCIFLLASSHVWLLPKTPKKNAALGATTTSTVRLLPEQMASCKELNVTCTVHVMLDGLYDMMVYDVMPL